MSDARAEILARIRSGVGRSLTDGGSSPASQRIQAHHRNLIPARSRLEHDQQIDLFTQEAIRVNATVVRVAGMAAVPGAVARYLSAHNLPTDVKIAPNPALRDIPWAEQSLLTVTSGRADGTEETGVTLAVAGIAETGTLMMLSTPEDPTTLNFLPRNHVAVVRAADICGAYEEAWTRLRAKADRRGRFMPRTVNWITGPSRTADIELELLLGMHGPQRLHIVIVDDTAD
jgi:L-lactate dehydrogenase complex protein LldG